MSRFLKQCRLQGLVSRVHLNDETKLSSKNSLKDSNSNAAISNLISSLIIYLNGLNQFKNNIRKLLSNIFNSANADKFIQDKVIVLRNGRAEIRFTRYSISAVSQNNYFILYKLISICRIKNIRKKFYLLKKH